MVQEMVNNHFPVADDLMAAKSTGPRSKAKKKRPLLDTDREELYAKAVAFFVNLLTLTPGNFNNCFANVIS